VPSEILGKVIDTYLAHYKSRFFMENTPTPKQKVKEAFRCTTGAELAAKLREYWKLKTLLAQEPNKDPEQTKLIDYAESIFAPGNVDSPRVGAGN
jgi:hypothetical protein